MSDMEGRKDLQDKQNKGLTAKFVQCKGLRAGVEAEIMVFARECVVLLLCFPVVTCSP